MTDPAPSNGRERQRRRTRASIVEAAVRLLKEPGEPTMGDIAEAAQVSRGTVYLHFPTLEHLLLEATINAVGTIGDVRSRIATAGDHEEDPVERAVAMIDALAESSVKSLALGRSLVRLTVDPGATEPGVPLRGNWRITTIEAATAPIRDLLEPVAYDRLVHALSLVAGWDALIVLTDVNGLPADQQAPVLSWAARALIRAALDEATTT
jgi:AcrR family transcriptional regulator